MKFRGLIRKRLEFPSVSLNRFYLGIFLGVLTSISFYLIFNLSREITRYVFSTTEHYDIWILTVNERWFYNLAFAFISSIFGEGICLKTWYEKPNQGYNPYFDYRRKSIYNDILVLNTNFLNVFAKTAIVYGIWFGETLGYLDFSIFPKYNYLWLLIILVLHLEQWKTIRLTFKNQCLKSFGIFSLSIMLLSFLLSIINPIDIKSIDKNYLSKSVDYNYQIDRPVSYYAKWNYRYSTFLDVYYVFPNSKIKDVPEILIHNKPVSLDSLCSLIIYENEWMPEFTKNKFTVHLHCDKNLKMNHIKTIKSELSKCGVNNISYASIPANLPYSPKACRYSGFSNGLADYSAYSQTDELNIDYLKKPRVILIELVDSAFIKMDELTIKKTDFIKAFIQNLKSGDFRQIQLYSSDSIDYQTYVSFRDYINYTVVKWRNFKSKNDFGKNYNELEIEDRIKFDLNYYFTIVELTDKQKEMLTNE